PRLSRRQLLRLEGSLRATPTGASRTPELRADRDAGSAYDLLRASRPAMGSYFEIRLGANVPGAAELAERALDLIDALEGQLSVYRDDSEVSRINASAYNAIVEVEPGLFGLLDRAVVLGEETEGAYDVTIGALSAAWGFFKGPKRVPDAESLEIARSRT